MRVFTTIGLVCAALFMLMASTCSKAIDNPQSIADTVAKIQAAAIAACGFEPTASTVTNIIGQASGGGDTTAKITEVASGICTAVTPPTTQSLLETATPWVYKGVKIEGKFVKE